MPDLKKLITLEALQAALPSWLKSSSKPSYTADEISDTNTTNKFVTSTEKSTWNAKGTYSKPTGGIPKSDLSQLVQNSLDLADSALQSESDPTVPSWAKQTNKPSYTQDEVTDGTTYKRVTQTEKNAWSGKQNALTTTQMNAVNSGINSTKVGQISTNQTNILYALNKVGKNNFNYTYVGDGSGNYGKTFTKAHATFEVQSDNTALKITTDGAVTTGNPYIFFMDENGYYINFKKWFDGRHYLTGIPSGASVSAHRIFYKADSQASVSLSSDTLLPDLSTATNVYIGIQVQTGQNYGSTGVLYQPMIILDTLYASDPSYESASLPNSDLTGLQAEDRAALAEVVDSGAKNLWNFANAGTQTVYSSTITKTDTDVTVTSTGTYGNVSYGFSLPAGNYVFSCKISDINVSGSASYQPRIILANNTSGTNAAGVINFTTNGTKSLEFTWTGGAIYVQYQPNASGNSFKASENMICTKAAFGVSNKFVPYRPSWDLIYSSLQCDVKYAKAPVSTSYSLIGSIKTKANRVCRVTVTQEYAAVAPTGLILSKSNQSSDFNTLTNRIAPPVETTTDDITLTISTLCYFTYDRVIYIWAKAKTASTNGNNFMALCEHFGDIDGVKNSMT